MFVPMFRPAHMLLTCLVVVAAGCSQDSPTVSQTSTTPLPAADRQTPDVPLPPVAAQPELHWKDAPFSGQADRCAVILNIRQLAASETVGHLAALLPVMQGRLQIAPSETEWVAVYLTALADTDHSIASEATMVVKLNRPSSVYEIAESRFAATEFEIVQGDVTYLRVIGNPDLQSAGAAVGFTSEAPMMAVYEYSETTFVICEENRLGTILAEQSASQSDLPDWPHRLQPLLQQAADTAHVIVAGSQAGDEYLQAAVRAAADELQQDGPLSLLADNTSGLMAALTFDASELFQLSLTGHSAADPQLMQVSLDQLQQQAEQYLNTQQQGLFATPTAFVLSVLQGRRTEVRDQHVSVSVPNPDGMPQAVAALQAALLSIVASAE